MMAALRDPIVHNVKIHPQHYRAVMCGQKTAEYRKFDRDYREGDTLILNEYIPESGIYTGRRAELIISHILTGNEVKEGYCVLSFQMIFPIVEPRISVTTWEKIYKLYLESQREIERLKEEKTQ